MEKREIVFVLSILLLLASCEGQPIIGPFDYFQIVLSWQPAVCSDSTLGVNCWQQPRERFSIHGVWPSLYSSDWIVQCNGSAFDPRQIVTIEAGLNQNWPDVIRGRNEAFWAYEWEKHGNCFENFYNQVQYFALGLNAFADVQNIQSILAANNTIPNGLTYSRTRVEAIIAAATKSRPALRCNRNYRSGSQQLHEISFCYSKNASGLEHCPSNANKCPNQFVWNSWGTFQRNIEVESI